MTVDLAALAQLASEATPGTPAQLAFLDAASPDRVAALVRVALAAKAAVDAFNSFESSVPFLVAMNMLRDELGNLDR